MCAAASQIEPKCQTLPDDGAMILDIQKNIYIKKIRMIYIALSAAQTALSFN